MQYKICKMIFEADVHFGNGMLSDSECTFFADTLFSALCQEAIKLDGKNALDKLVDYVQRGEICFSDAFPYMGETKYLPRPLCGTKENRSMKALNRKLEKKLKFIPSEKLGEYLSGNLETEEEYERLGKLGASCLRVHASIHGLEEANPYLTGVFHFAEKCGLYFILAYESAECFRFVEPFIRALSFTGIGGKVSSGFGRFGAVFEEMEGNWYSHLSMGSGEMAETYMTLCISLPEDKELEKALEGAQYQIQKRSGFVSSLTYAEGKALRKRDFYAVQAGACFQNVYKGAVFDVSHKEMHPVYRYGKSMFWRLSYV